MFESGAFFEVADGEFDYGVFAMEPVSGDRVEIGPVGDEGVVSPVGPQLMLFGDDDTVYAYDGADQLLSATVGVADWSSPGR